MQIGEARLSALLIALLTGVGLTLMLNGIFRSVVPALQIAIPVSLILGGLLFVFASDDIRPRDKAGKKQTTEQTTKGNLP